MAGDWLKIEKGTPRKAEILSIASRLGISSAEAFKLCFGFWAWADDNFADGVLPEGLTPSALDSELAYKPGFSEALIAVGWLSKGRNSRLIIPNFDRHLGQSAKKRSQNAYRQKQFRQRNANSNADSNAKVTLSNGDPLTLNSTSVSSSEGKEGVVGETIGGLSWPVHLTQLWGMQLRRAPTKHDSPYDLPKTFEELMRHGADPKAMEADILSPSRNRAEDFWDFRRRWEPKKNSQPTTDLHAGGKAWLEKKMAQAQ